MNKTEIEWTDYTWNPITGCTHGCSYCYARRMAFRQRGRNGYPYDEPFKPTFHPDRLLEPSEVTRPSTIFTVSMGDFFGKEVNQLWQELVLTTVFHCPRHEFLILTKQPQNIPLWEEEYWPSNLWLGVSVDGVKNGQSLIDNLYESHFPHNTFVSFEPLLGRVKDLDIESIQWAIIGAQTGPKKSQPQWDWVLDIVLASRDNNIPVFIKDNLEWKDVTPRPQEFPKELIE